ncbi:DUF262 domain-containing protein [Tetragenococcus halophilus]|uniref:DUF262 domain-containing protein n=1 Tax=Tetragenococcus halophilus TaxID=51669 RepID=UPI00255F75BD|nr:DUF262 domain-containing protein [Tetragenococcus halophilus]GMG67008.1 hypothetical protein TEHIT2_21990 [Tetragenococcus halophilus]
MSKEIINEETEEVIIKTELSSDDDTYGDSDLFTINSWGADLSFRELTNMYDEDELQKPELQRYYVWDKREASRFIESILLGLPVPSIFLARTVGYLLALISHFLTQGIMVFTIPLFLVFCLFLLSGLSRYLFTFIFPKEKY